jgi:CO dehydrogenase/acetyl-CoA synthase delta subunit
VIEPLEQLYEQVIDEAIEATRSYLAELGAKAVIEDLQISTSMAVKDRRPPRAVQTNPAEMTLEASDVPRVDSGATTLSRPSVVLQVWSRLVSPGYPEDSRAGGRAS